MRAVLERDLLAEGARPRAFLVRGLVAAGSALMVLGGVLGSRWTSGYLEARTFERASWIALISLVLLTPVATVDAIVDERVRGTLPLVLSTPEGPRGFAAGKFLSRAGLAFGLFAATLPLLAVCWLCDGGSFARLLSFTLLGGAVILEGVSWALLASAVSRRFESAALLAIALPPARWALAAVAASSLPAVGPGAAWLLLGTTPLPTLGGKGVPPGACPASELPWLPPGLRAGPEPLYLAGAILFAVLTVAATASLLSREGTLALPKSGRMRLPLHRRAWRLALSWNPLLAKDLVATKAIGTLLTLGVLGVLLAVVALFSVSGPGGMSRAAEVHITAVSRTVMASSGLAAMGGATLLSLERAHGTIDILRVTRLSVRELLLGKVLAALPAAGLAWAFSVGQVLVAANTGAFQPQVVPPALVAVTLVPASFGVLGIGWGLAARSPGGALSSLGCAWWAAFPILFLARDFLGEKVSDRYLETMAFPCLVLGSPWLLVVGLLEGLESLARGRPLNGPSSSAFMFYVSLAWLCGNALYLWWAGRDLPRRFREALLREEDLSMGGATHPFSWRVWREHRVLERDERRRGIRAPSKEWHPVHGPQRDSRREG